MGRQPNVFVSFSSSDQSQVRKLFAGLELQNVKIWDYSDTGQELPLAYGLHDSLKEKIELCEHFIAIISPNSIDEQIGRHAQFEVKYAIECGKLKQNKLLPMLFNEPSHHWLELYANLQNVLWTELDTNSPEKFEDCVSQICEWMAVPYIPPSLKDTRVFFSQLFLEEAETKKISNGDFKRLLRIMDGCASKVLENDWQSAREKTNYFLNFVDNEMPRTKFHYPLVIRGVCELQLEKFEEAEQTFLLAIKNCDAASTLLLGLSFAGLGHTYFSQERFVESLNVFQRAQELLDGDDDINLNHLVSLIYAGEDPLNDEEVLGKYDLLKVSDDERIKIIALSGAINYKKGNFFACIDAYKKLRLEDLNEAAALHYSFALREYERDDEAIKVLSFAASKIKSANLYHQLANAHLLVGNVNEALDIYKKFLCGINTPAEYARQILVEYAQIIRYIDNIEAKKFFVFRKQNPARTDTFNLICGSVIDFNLFGSPQTKADCFYTGFAYYLLGNDQMARHYYDSSSGFSEDYYDEIELTA